MLRSRTSKKKLLSVCLPFVTTQAVLVLSVVWSRYNICLCDSCFWVPAAAATPSSPSHLRLGLPTSHAPDEYNHNDELVAFFLRMSGEESLLFGLDPAGLEATESLSLLLVLVSKFCFPSRDNCTCVHLSTPKMTRVFATLIEGSGRIGK